MWLNNGLCNNASNIFSSGLPRHLLLVLMHHVSGCEMTLQFCGRCQISSHHPQGLQADCINQLRVSLMQMGIQTPQVHAAYSRQKCSSVQTLKHVFLNSLTELQCCNSAAECVQHVGHSSILALCMHPGDEVTISYVGDLSSQKDSRQSTFRLAWHFACSCPRCTFEEALHWKVQCAMNVLGTEADKYNSHDPDRYSCCYRYSASPAFIAPLSYQFVKCAANTSAFVFELSCVRFCIVIPCMPFGLTLSCRFFTNKFTYMLVTSCCVDLTAGVLYVYVFSWHGTSMQKHADCLSSQHCCRTALMTGRRYRYFELARELNEAISFFEEKLCKTDLPLKHQHWAMFSVLDAYLCLWQCYKALKDTKKLQQVSCT